jgi:hypothetical protein
MEERQSPVGVFVDAHRRAHEVRPQRAGRDLQGEPAPFDGVVVADAAFFLKAQDFTGGAGAVGGKSGSRLLRA